MPGVVVVVWVVVGVGSGGLALAASPPGGASRGRARIWPRNKLISSTGVKRVTRLIKLQR